MSRIKILLAVWVIVLMVSVTVLVGAANYGLEQAGGIKQVIINAGREIKEISKEMDREAAP